MHTELYACYNIAWDTEKDEMVNLPAHITVGIEEGSYLSEDEDPQLFDLQDHLADALANHTGYCVNGFSFKFIGKLENGLTESDVDALANLAAIRVI